MIQFDTSAFLCYFVHKAKVVWSAKRYQHNNAQMKMLQCNILPFLDAFSNKLPKKETEKAKL